MSLTQEQITRLQKLTALKHLDELEISSVVDSFDSISPIDISHIDHISRSGKGSLDLRPDVVIADRTLPDALLHATWQKTAAHQIVLAGIMQGE